jgi:hypothetical protein
VRVSFSGDFVAACASDYQLVDGTQTVTYTAPRAGGNTTLTIHFADAHAYTLLELVRSGGLYQAGDRRWGLGNAEFPAGITPQRGDTITDASGTVWELIADPALDDLQVSWFCPSRKAR